MATILSEYIAGFNPRARVGRDAKLLGQVNFFACFNPRARVGRDDHWDEKQWREEGFNPRARVGRDALAAMTGYPL